MAPRDRTTVIVDVLRDAFAPLMRAAPAAFRAKYRKMARDPHAFYRGTACSRSARSSGVISTATAPTFSSR